MNKEGNREKRRGRRTYSDDLKAEAVLWTTLRQKSSRPAADDHQPRPAGPQSQRAKRATKS